MVLEQTDFSHLIFWGHVHRVRRFLDHLVLEVMSCYLCQILLSETVAKMLPSSEVRVLSPAFTEGKFSPHNTKGTGWGWTDTDALIWG